MITTGTGSARAATRKRNSAAGSRRQIRRFAGGVVPTEMDEMMREGTPEQIARDAGVPQNEKSSISLSCARRMKDDRESLSAGD